MRRIGDESPVFPPPAPSRRAGRVLGAVAGAIGLGCCLYPVALVLIGVASASSAVALGEHLYRVWGWVFKLGAVAFAAVALAIRWRRARSCGAAARPRVVRTALWLFGSGVATYGALFVLTGRLARTS